MSNDSLLSEYLNQSVENGSFDHVEYYNDWHEDIQDDENHTDHTNHHPDD